MSWPRCLSNFTRSRPQGLEAYGQSSGTRQVVYSPPRWTTHPQVWERAFEIFHGQMPSDDLTFVHRDFHPGNMLWSRTRLTGIVDWKAACLGPASIDVGHCRLNMLFYDALQADRLRDAWERVSGRRYDPWADIMSIVGILDSLRRRDRTSRGRACSS